MPDQIDRRRFLSQLGVTVGSAALGASVVDVAMPRPAAAAEPPKGRIPSKPLKFGHITLMSGPGAIIGEPAYKGHLLAAEEINAEGGLLGKRKIETIVGDEAAGLDANVKELKRMKLSAGIDWFTGVITAHNQLALGVTAEELRIPTIMTEGCIDKLFEIEIPNPHYVFGMTNILSADGVTCAIAVAQAWPEARRIAVMHPDYAFGRWFQLHFDAAIQKLLPEAQLVSEAWIPLGTMEFSTHISKTMAAKPDVLVTALWGGMYVAFYKQGLRLGLFDKTKVCGNISFGVVPHAIGQDHPEGTLAGVHSNYHFTHPPGNVWPLNKKFVEAYHKRWNEYPSYCAEAAYTGMYFLKLAVEKANKLTGGWPDIDAIVSQLEGLSMAGPAGYVAIRREDHRAFKDVTIGFSKNLPQYPFQVWDPDRVITIPVRAMTAPPDWPKPGKGHNDASATVNWIKNTWPKVSG